jgi:Cysteine dioxygenase type I
VLVPTVDDRAGRLAHPSFPAPGQPVLDFRTLRALALDLAHGAARGSHRWTDEGDRRHACIKSTDLYDAWVISWSPSSSLDMHDHGGSQGVFRVIRGSLVESYTDVSSPLVRTRLISTGDTVKIKPTRVHGVSNPYAKASVSLHLYSPPLASMTFFEMGPDGPVQRPAP